MIPNLQFAINRVSAAKMAFADFAAMAQRLGVRAVEIRNDLGNVEMADGTPARDIGAIASAHGLVVRSINALQRFEQYDATREEEARALAAYAVQSGAQALVLCPTNSHKDQRDAQQRHSDLVLALRKLQPLLADHGLTGLVEALGFQECAVRRKSQAARAIAEVDGNTTFALVHDTFHHHVAGEGLFFPELTGLAHISGVEDPTLDASHMRDGHRVLVGPADRLGNLAQLRMLLAAGYAGYLSFESFATEVSSSADIELRLRSSMDYVSRALAAPAGA